MSSVDRFDYIPYYDLSPEHTWTKLGKGSFGAVWKGEYLGLEVAIKEVLDSDEYDVQKYFQRECRIMQEARHPNIVQYLGLCRAPPPPPSAFTPPPALGTSARTRILIISEYLPRGNLRTYIWNVNLPLPWRLRVAFAVDTSRALAYLHARKCLHRDLKGENLLITENERVKVCDFGFARIAARNEDEMRRISYCGTDGYMSPEILSGDEFGLETDVFSLGVIFCELISRKLTDDHTFKRTMPDFGIAASEIAERASPGCPASFLDLAVACTSVRPSDRPTMRQVLDRLGLIEAEVLLQDAREAAGAPRNATTSTYGSIINIGSVSFAGTTKLGTLASARSRPSAPRLPSFDGLVRVPARAGSATNPPPNTVANNNDDDDDDDMDVSMLALAEVKIADETPPSGLGDEPQHARGDSEDYSTAVIKPPRASSHRPSLVSNGGGSEMTIRASPVSERAELAPPEQLHLPSTPQEEDEPLLEPTSSSMRVTINHASPTGSEDGGVPAAEGKDTLKSLLSPAVAFPRASTAPMLHRFSLVKPPWRFLAFSPFSASDPSSPPRAPATAPPSAGKSAPPSMRTRKASFDAAVAKFFGSVVANITASPPSVKSATATTTTGIPQLNVCEVCSKKLGALKAHLECDDCGIKCHLKCSDVCPTSCSPLDEEAADDVPALPSSGPSKLVKKSRRSVLRSSSSSNIV